MDTTTTSDTATLLVVDDNPDNVALLVDLLQADYRVLAANSGRRALELARSEPTPGLILLDVMMPGMDGYAVLAALREDARTQDIPVIFVTAMDTTTNEEHGLKQGAVDYITKPIRPAIVQARVRTHLELKRSRDWLKSQNLLLQHQSELILAAASEGILGADRAGVINFINPAAATLLGYDSGELIGQSAQELLVPSEPAAGPTADNPLQIACSTGVTIRNRELMFRHRNGQTLALELSCVPIREQDQLTGVVVTLQDRSERKRYLAELERKSNFDDLTALPNRNLLNDRLAHAIERTRQEGLVAVLTINLDRFNSINDSLGRDAGNAVLCEVALRVAKNVRSTDTLARLDGHEFVVISEVTDPDDAALLAQSVLEAFAKHYTHGTHEFFLTGSIGIAVSPRDGDDSETLLRNAAAAMVKAKSDGGNRFAFYAAEMNARSLGRLEMENGLRRAIDKDELVVFYQPQLNLRTGEIMGAEALVRWQHPERGLVMPGAFIPLAEDSGLIVPLGEWVLRTACKQIKAWQALGLPPITVAVNMSARHFAAQDVVKLAVDILKSTGLAANYLELELTESVVMADAEAFIRTTKELKNMGIKLSIDDFGTGFSSLNYLKRFAIDSLKIDQSFVQDITHDPNSAAIAMAIISLAHSLKLTAIAEGVETEAQLNFLRRRGCDSMQGYFFSKPVPAAEFEQMLREQRKLVFAPVPNRRTARYCWWEMMPTSSPRSSGYCAARVTPS